MATKADHIPSAMAATASLVGNTFVNKYYNVLHQSPQVVHRFYTDRSILSRAEAGPNGSIDIVLTQAGIDNKIMSLDYRDFRAEIKTVDSLESLNGSVLVMVTGALSSQSRPKRNFVQTFFLAPQEIGYFVLNDMFRYLDGETIPVQFLAVPMANGTMDHPIQVPNPVLVDPHPPRVETRQYTVPTPTPALEVSLPPDHFRVPEVKEALKVDEKRYKVEENNKVEQNNKVVNNPSHVPDEVDVRKTPLKENHVPLTEEPNAEETPKKSYASILRLQKDASVVSNGVVNSVPSLIIEENITSSQAVIIDSSASNGLVENVEKPAESTTVDGPEGDGLSVYVKNLPLKITTSELEEEFGKFGALKSGGINLRNQRIGICFAFIEFEETSSAQKAIQASPILIGGRKVYVEEKKTMVQRSGGRGRFNQGRGYSYDAPRGRGYFGGRRTNGHDFGRANGQDSARKNGEDSARTNGEDSTRTNRQDFERNNNGRGNGGDGGRGGYTGYRRTDNSSHGWNTKKGSNGGNQVQE